MTETAYVAPKPPRTKILLLALVVTATLVAWGVLVYAAIDFGAQARSGETTAWVFLAIATVGAAACLFTTLILGGRILTLLKSESAPPRPQGGRRAAR
jgi:RsiW-degrading membrane proteinase PrsW (M82 family)